MLPSSLGQHFHNPVPALEVGYIPERDAAQLSEVLKPSFSSLYNPAGHAISSARFSYVGIR